MLCWVQILTTPTAETPGACLLLHFDDRRYIFGNVSEGTQRAISSRGISFRKVGEIFLTGPTDWQSNGGLLGMILTIADTAQNSRDAQYENNKKLLVEGKNEVQKTNFDQLNIHGGKNLTHMMATARKFIFRNGLPTMPNEWDSDPRWQAREDSKPDWKDEKIRVWKVPVKGNHSSKKRSIDAVSDSGGEPSSLTAKQRTATRADDAEALTQAHLDQELRIGVVKNMFHSSWKFDALHEVELSEVKLPATIYVRDANGELQHYRGPMSLSNGSVPQIKVLVRKPWPASQVARLPPTKPSHVSMCYVVKTYPRRGKFDPVAAAALGVEKKDFKILTLGQRLVAKDGKVVTPDMVMSPPTAGKGFIVVEIPYLSYIDGFLARPEWSNEEIMGGIEVMFWISREPEVLRDSRILSFMRQHGSIRHTALARDHAANPLALEAPILEVVKLNSIDRDRFPILSFEQGNDPSIGLNDSQVSVPYVKGVPGTCLQLSPQVATLDRSFPPINLSPALQEIQSRSEVIALSDAARFKISDPAFLEQIEAANADMPNQDAEVIPLGTGSALPSKTRNVSATLVCVPGIGNYLFDVGENTLGQLRRLYGYAGADAVIRDLRAIWISHVHADHHLGTVSVIRRFFELTNEDISNGSTFPPRPQQLAVLAHQNYHDWLSEYSEVEHFGYGTLLVNPVVVGRYEDRPQGHKRRRDDPLVLPEIRADDTNRLAASFGIASIASCFVDHCADARAVAITLTSGLKIAYSGDCRPSRDFALIGMDAHLLIHESTLDDELVADAREKKHCTMSEALGVARQMRARNVLLTHFSQRYPRIPVISEDATPTPTPAEEENGRDGELSTGSHPHRDMPVLFAFDYMRVRLGDFRIAQEFLPALRRLYEDEEREKEEEKMRNKKRMLEEEKERLRLREEEKEAKRRMLEEAKERRNRAVDNVDFSFTKDAASAGS